MTQHRQPILSSAEEIALAEERLARFDRDGLGYDIETFRRWVAARQRDPAAPCPPPSKFD